MLFVLNNNPADHGKESNKRVWSFYNESLVRRMKDILEIKDIENYRLDLMNQNVRKNEGHSLFLIRSSRFWQE